MIGISREPRSCVLRQRQERSPLQKLLDYLLKGLEKRDPQQFFAWPVTDHIAPGYSQIIQQPMDFSTMKQKIDENQYSTLSEYIVRSSLWILFPCGHILCLKSNINIFLILNPFNQNHFALLVVLHLDFSCFCLGMAIKKIHMIRLEESYKMVYQPTSRWQNYQKCKNSGVSHDI